MLPSNAALDEEGFKILNTGWNDGGSWKFSLRADKFPDNKGLLANWVIKLEFEFPVTDIQVIFSQSKHRRIYTAFWCFYLT